MSLLEVLIAMFVLSIGLLGVAALIPVGRFAIVETGKSDRSGACGRAALSEIKVRRMLEYGYWSNPTPAQNNQAFAIDPLGVIREMPTNLGGATGNVAAVIPRITLKSSPTGPAMTFEQADRIFTWHDDLEFSLPEDIKPPPPGESKRPRANLGVSGLPDIAGSYSWLVTVTPAAAEAGLAVADRTLFSVSVVVCYRRDFSPDESTPPLPNGEHTAQVTFLGGGYGGGSVRLASPRIDPPLRLRENEWVMLCGQVSGRTVCKWYRVVSADSGSPTTMVSLLGPDWDPSEDANRNGKLDPGEDTNGNGVLDGVLATAVAIDHVVGVYTTTVELDRNLLWNK